MSKNVSSSTLKRVVSFILNIYAPAWFMIKKQCLQLDECDRKIVLPVLQNNKYFALPENILLAAVADADKIVRKEACHKIIECRSKRVLGSVRYFDKGKIVI